MCIHMRTTHITHVAQTQRLNIWKEFAAKTLLWSQVLTIHWPFASVTVYICMCVCMSVFHFPFSFSPLLRWPYKIFLLCNGMSIAFFFPAAHALISHIANLSWNCILMTQYWIIMNSSSCCIGQESWQVSKSSYGTNRGQVLGWDAVLAVQCANG